MTSRNQIFTITKKIAKHGEQAIIIIPKMLNKTLSPGKIVKLNIELLNAPELIFI